MNINRTIDPIRRCKSLPPELLWMIVEYAYPYYTIEKRIRNNIETVEHDWASPLIYGGKVATNKVEMANGELWKNCYCINRMGDITWNIKYVVPKAMFEKGDYTIEVNIGCNVLITGHCIVEEDDDNVILWSPDTSLPISHLSVSYCEIIATVMEKTRGVQHSGIMTVEHIYLNTSYRRQLGSAYVMLISDVCCCLGSAGIVATGSYSKLDKLEIFPGIKEYDSTIFTKPIV